MPRQKNARRALRMKCRVISMPASPIRRWRCLKPAWQRLKAEELLAQQLSQLQSKRERDALRAPALPLRQGGLHEQLLAVLPFGLTAAQRRVVEEIAHDLMQAVPMHRLLQGDVGSGKTVVAQYAMLVAVSNGYQAALMAPTEVLARQHARFLERSLAASKVRIGLLTGSISPARRRKLLEEISEGKIDLIVGTHAVIHAVARSEARFAKLGLVVIDEQHKFGVRERAALRDAWARVFESVDVVLCPVTSTVAFAHLQEGYWGDRVIEVNGEQRRYHELEAWPAIVGAAYLPSTSTPVGRTSRGLPVGVQVVGPYLHDRRTIAVSPSCSTTTPSLAKARVMRSK